MLKALGARYPDLKVVLTLGSQGSCCLIRGCITREKGFPVTPVDTTGAGDTYTGYFLRSYAAGMPIAHAMRLASMAAAISARDRAPSPPGRAFPKSWRSTPDTACMDITCP